MKPDRLPRTLLIVFVAALALYILSFTYIQNRRTAKGPWEVVFKTDGAGQPELVVEQKSLRISERIIFPEQVLEQKNLAQKIVFNDPGLTTIPFGEIVFQDLTFLPGTVTLNLFGYEVELLPRVLFVDKQEHAWEAGKITTVTGPGQFKPHKKNNRVGETVPTNHDWPNGF